MVVVWTTVSKRTAGSSSRVVVPRLTRGGVTGVLPERFRPAPHPTSKLEQGPATNLSGPSELGRYDEGVSDSRVEPYLEALVDVARGVLGTEFVGAYAAGSLALNAFQAGRSDIDVVLLCRDPLSETVKLELIARLRHRSLPCPARGLELVVYTVDTAQSGTAEPGFELELNDGPAMAFRQSLQPADRPVADGTFWYGLDRSILHQSGRVLAGPPAAEAFAELPPADLRSLLIDSLRWWMALPDQVDDRSAAGADDAVLGACRALVRHRYGRWLSKVDAGRRLIVTGYRPVEVVEQSIAARSGGSPPSDRQARAFQERILKELLSATSLPA